MFIGRTDICLARIAEWTWFNPTFALFGGGLFCKTSIGIIRRPYQLEALRIVSFFWCLWVTRKPVFIPWDVWFWAETNWTPGRETTNPPNKEVSNQLELQYLGHKPWTNWMFDPKILHEMQSMIIYARCKVICEIQCKDFLLTNCVLGCSVVSHVKSISCKIIKASLHKTMWLNIERRNPGMGMLKLKVKSPRVSMHILRRPKLIINEGQHTELSGRWDMNQDVLVFHLAMWVYQKVVRHIISLIII